MSIIYGPSSLECRVRDSESHPVSPHRRKLRLRHRRTHPWDHKNTPYRVDAHT